MLCSKPLTENTFQPLVYPLNKNFSQRLKTLAWSKSVEKDLCSRNSGISPEVPAILSQRSWVDMGGEMPTKYFRRLLAEEGNISLAFCPIQRLLRVVLVNQVILAEIHAERR